MVCSACCRWAPCRSWPYVDQSPPGVGVLQGGAPAAADSATSPDANSAAATTPRPAVMRSTSADPGVGVAVGADAVGAGLALVDADVVEPLVAPAVRLRDVRRPRLLEGAVDAVAEGE